jgi:hypothetical protein
VGGERGEEKLVEESREVIKACEKYKACDVVEGGGHKVDSCVRVVVLLMFSQLG